MTAEARKVEVLLRLGRTDDALRVAAELPCRDHPSPEFYRLHGRTLRAAGRHFDAEQAFREALSLSPGDAGALADVATSLVGQKRHREALSFARDAVSARPDRAAYHALLGIIAEALHLDTEAERELGAARTLSPDDAEPHVTYGFTALRLGKFPEAQSAFRDALAIDPQRAEAHRGLARALGESGRIAEGRLAWAEALALDPDIADAKMQTLLWPKREGPRWIRAILATPAWVGFVLAAGGFIVALESPWAGVPLFVVAALGPVVRIGMEEE